MRVMNEVRPIQSNAIFVLELNTGQTCCLSLESGIDVVRNRIKGFAQKKVTLPQGRHKLVILDEADR